MYLTKPTLDLTGCQHEIQLTTKGDRQDELIIRTFSKHRITLSPDFVYDGPIMGAINVDIKVSEQLYLELTLTKPEDFMLLAACQTVELEEIEFIELK